MVQFIISEHGLKGLLKKFSPSRAARVRVKALKRGQDFMLQTFIENSRFDTGNYAGSWRRGGSGTTERFVENIAEYAKYVTAPTQFTIHEPQAEAGAAYIALMTRKFRPEMRRIVLEAVREELL